MSTGWPPMYVCRVCISSGPSSDPGTPGIVEWEGWKGAPAPAWGSPSGTAPANRFYQSLIKDKGKEEYIKQ